MSFEGQKCTGICTRPDKRTTWQRIPTLGTLTCRNVFFTVQSNKSGPVKIGLIFVFMLTDC